MNLDILNSDEFQKDFIDTIEKINNDYNLSIKCGQITCDSKSITVYIEDEQASS